MNNLVGHFQTMIKQVTMEIREKIMWSDREKNEFIMVAELMWITMLFRL